MRKVEVKPTIEVIGGVGIVHDDDEKRWGGERTEDGVV